MIDGLMIGHLLSGALAISPSSTPTPVPTPSAVRAYVIQPGDYRDPKTGEIKHRPPPTRPPRPSVDVIRPCMNPPDVAEGSADYRDCDVEVVTGFVKDVEPMSSLGALVLLEVEDAFPASVGPLILFDQAERGAPPWDGRPIAPGDRVLVTLLRRPSSYSWGCGRVRPCTGPPPKVNWTGVELFRPANWP